jgi:hypothetical protein
MVTDYQKTAHLRGPEKEREPEVSQAGAAGKDDACRCKKASEMSPGELVKLMISDLAFWKKPNKG